MSETSLANIEQIVSKYESKPQYLIQILNKIQEEKGYLPREDLNFLVKKLKISWSHLYGVITFYENYKLEKPGKYIITVCMGTACFVKGAKEIASTIKNTLEIDVGETTKDGLFTFERVACLGCCALAPVIQINQEVHGKMTSKKVERLLKEIKKNEEGNE